MSGIQALLSRKAVTIYKRYGGGGTFLRTHLAAVKTLKTVAGRGKDVESITQPKIPLDPKKLELLNKLGIAESADEEKHIKTGADLRRERKTVEKQKKHQLKVSELRRAEARGGTAPGTIKSKKSQQQQQQQQVVRFRLGNGVEVLTANQLMSLVKSTSPYLFPESAPKLILDDTYDDEDDEEDDEDDDNVGGSAGNKAAGRSRGGGEQADASTSLASTLQSSHQDQGIDASNKIHSLTLSRGPMGWLEILRSKELLASLPPCDSPSPQQRIDYYALCMSAHFATVATYVPTDVDSKIRGHCWFDPDESVLKSQFEILKNALSWDVDSVSKRTIRLKEIDKDQPISGHNGEWLGVLAGALGSFLRNGHADLAKEAEVLIEKELEREAQAFRYLRSLKPTVLANTVLLKMSSIITHNVGDLDQGLSYWEGTTTNSNNNNTTSTTTTTTNMSQGKRDGDGNAISDSSSINPITPTFKDISHVKLCQKFSRLAHERPERFGGEFLRAKRVYKELIAAEGHRHYPLREPKCLRTTPDLMLPLGPWLENWGRIIATHPGLSHEDRLNVVRQLLRGCDSNSKGWCVPNQVGYYRALSGIASVTSMERLAKDLDKECLSVLKSHDVRMHLGISEQAFATKLGARARDLLEEMEEEEV